MFVQKQGLQCSWRARLWVGMNSLDYETSKMHGATVDRKQVHPFFWGSVLVCEIKDTCKARMKVGAWLGVTLRISLISSIYLSYISSKVGIYLLHTGQKWIWKPIPRPSWYESFEKHQAPKQYLMNSKDQGLGYMPNQHRMFLGWFEMPHVLMILTRFETKLEIYKMQS
jgi:hypothetical protein